MGHGTGLAAKPRMWKSGQRSTLHEHPNLSFPPPPVVDVSDADYAALLQWACDCCAELVSPRQEPGEDSELACTDVAAAMRALPKFLTSGAV